MQQLSISFLEKKDRPEMVKVCDISFNKAVTDPAHSDFFSNYFDKDPSYRCSDTLVLKRDGRIISAVTVLRRKIILDGIKIPAGCIANVCTLPEERHKGRIKLLMEKSAGVMREKGFQIGFLLGRPELYSRFGWENITGKSIEARGPLPGGRGGHNISVRKAEVKDFHTVKSLYDKNYTRLNGFFERSRKHWESFLIKFRSLYLGEFRVFILEKDRKPRGYACIDEKSKTVLEMFFADKPESGYFTAVYDFLKAGGLKLNYYDPLYITELEKLFGKITYPEINHKMFILPSGRLSLGGREITSAKHLKKMFGEFNYTFSLCDKF
ncbi:MAG: GNAT family N-acetyltransferase [Candidatus Aureabacteria bacterium]|nr:GNAT family N-acetyltransferase [Candidatus Auribacterota bacterium]